MLVLVLLVAALILFVLAAIQTSSPKINLTAAGLACLTLAVLVRFGAGLV
jgi:hypothetical protein